MPEQPNEKLYEGALMERPTRVDPGHMPYAELDVVTNFSFLRGASHPDELVFTSALLGQKAMTVTDVNTLSGVVRAFEASRKIEGFQLIVGARLVFTDDTPDLLVWPTDRAAYGRLCRILTTGRMRAPKGECHLTIQDLHDRSEGLLAAACVTSPGNSIDTLRDCLSDRLSLAVSLAYGPDDADRLASMIDFSKRTRVPLVATNHVHYHDPGRRPLQDVMTCTREKCTLADAGFRLFANAERYLKSPEQMHRLFAAHPAAIERGLWIANQCKFRLSDLRYEYPTETVPKDRSASQHLRELTYAGAARRYPKGISDKVRALLEKELNFICGSEYESYFLTVHDLVHFARSQGILCQGRGSAANSAVCYCLGVTSVDPENFQLVFERFASESRQEPPDIDIDFEHERREEVIQYIYRKYGRDRAGMTASLITYRGRSAVRDVGKALGFSQDVLDVLAGKLDWWHRGTLMRSQLREAGIDYDDPTIRHLLSLTSQLLGFPRHLSQHVGGLVISRTPLCELVPIENAAMEDRTVIEWDKDDLDVLKMFKVDVLALGMLTCISKSLRHISEYSSGSPIELHTIPHEDPAVYDMICDADTIGVFQIESRAQMTMLPRLRPREFYDLVIEVAIVRPGPIQGDMVHPYLRRRNKEEIVEYPSQALRDVLQKTLGVPLFQEQAMRIVMVAAGFTAAEADKLRRTMAAWRRNGEIEVFGKKIIDGMIAHGYERDFAERTFSQLRGFGEYGFPESHAASFANLVYASSWIKRYHPAAFCCALLNSQPMGFYAPAQIVRDAREHGVEVRPIDVNESEWDCTLEKSTQEKLPQAAPQTWGFGGPAVRLGFRQIRGLKESIAQNIIDARHRDGKFRSIDHLTRAANLSAATLRRLADADAFGSLNLTRRPALWRTIRAIDDSPLLFDDPERDVVLPQMPPMQEVRADYTWTGLSLKCHPVSLIRETLRAMKIIPAADLKEMKAGRFVRVAGIVLIRQRPGTASGIVFETIEDETGVANLIIRPDVFDRYRVAARHATLVRADGYIERQGQVIHLMTKRMFDLSNLLDGYQGKSRDFH